MKIENFNKSAIIYNNQKISYGELIEKIGEVYENLNIETDDKVAIFFENRCEWIYSLFGIWQKNGICILIDYLSSIDEVKYILSDSTPKVILVSNETLKVAKEAVKLLSFNIEVINIDDFKFKKIDFKQKKISNSKIALITYTSGTTGEPKGVVLTFKNLHSNINSLKNVKIATKSDVVISLLPFHHSYPLMTTILTPLSVGATISIISEISSEVILKTLQRDRVTIFIGVPRLYDLFHKSIIDKINSNIFLQILFKIMQFLNSKPLSKIVFNSLHKRFGRAIKYFVSGGAKLDFEVAKDFEALGFKVIEGYGLTETSPIISFNPPHKVKLGSVGKVIDRVKVKIIEEEIVVSGENVMQGYFNLMDKTAEVLKDGWFYTGDLGYLDEDNYLFITGRKKDMLVLSSGKNVNPEEIENSLIKVSNLIKEVGVTLKNGTLFAIIYPNYENLKDTLNITEAIKWRVIDKYNLKAHSYKRVVGFKVVNRELPKTRLGKIKHFKLGEFLNDEIKEIKDEPSDEIYLILKNYLKGVSNKEVSQYDNIEIDLGFDSLAMVELLSFIDFTFGIEMDEVALSKHLSVKSLYEFIKEKNLKISEGEVNWQKIISKDIDFKIETYEKSLNFFSKFLHFFFKIYFRVKVKGVKNLPSKPFIIAPNHESYLDGFLMMALLPKDILKDSYFIADEKFFESELKKKLAKYSHVIPLNINTNLQLSMQKSIAILKSGKNIIIFPEGARSRDGKLLEFKKLFAILAKELNIPIVPVTIDGSFEAFPIGKILPKPKQISVKFLKPIEPNGTYEEIRDEVKSAIKKSL